ncbi:hypothetical protein DRW48_15635 [Paracoccus suum]|uniref:RNA polymerase subunit sigma n=1 Tax=Paracoccus suum TaxID=2259340 RepID=A0A344PNG2_9RHOB|nr:sigma-70 family RNA polymerase sigma factor [Paracoccus suum]AXC50917.1 hypothetical protein DRW48_15635 [Paracoccus suum]
MTARDTENWEALLRAANAGDSAAYARFLTVVTPTIRGIVRSRAGTSAGGMDPADCEDVVQTVLLAIHLRRASWRPDAPVRPWLYAIARHKLIDALRARRLTLPLDDLAEVLPAPAPTDPADRVDAQRLLARLPPREAAILRATALEGHTAAEAGADLGMTEGAVRVALHRALRRLAAWRGEG